MALELYRKKRNFKTTPEPTGKPVKPRRQGLAFVIQKHAATRLHYDFRLELDGVLLSWAVPKGPSLDPKDKRLPPAAAPPPPHAGRVAGGSAVAEGEYGAGAVMSWDRGAWEPEGDPRKDYERGRLSFRLHGQKLKGSWHL